MADYSGLVEEIVALYADRDRLVAENKALHGLLCAAHSFVDDKELWEAIRAARAAIVAEKDK